MATRVSKSLHASAASDRPRGATRSRSKGTHRRAADCGVTFARDRANWSELCVEARGEYRYGAAIAVVGRVLDELIIKT